MTKIPKIHIQGPFSEITITKHTLILASKPIFHTCGILHEFFRRKDWRQLVFDFSHFNRTDILYLAYPVLGGFSCQTPPSKLLIHCRRYHIWNCVWIYNVIWWNISETLKIQNMIIIVFYLPKTCPLYIVFLYIYFKKSC